MRANAIDFLPCRPPEGISFSPEGNKMQNLQRAVNTHVDGRTLSIYHPTDGSMALFGHAPLEKCELSHGRGVGLGGGWGGGGLGKEKHDAPLGGY